MKTILLFLLMAFTAQGAYLALNQPAGCAYYNHAGATDHLLNSLVAYWKMDENISSGSRADSIGTHTLTDNGTVGNTASGIINRAASIPGTLHSYLSVADHADFSGGTSFTIQVWTKWATITDNTPIIAKWGIANEWVLLVNTIPSSAITWFVRNLANTSTVTIGTSNPSPNVWHQWCVGFDSVNQVIWLQLDGGNRLTAAYTTACRDTTDPIAFGEYSSDCCPITASIDEVGYWKRVLTSAEVIKLYNGGSGLPLSSMHP